MRLNYCITGTLCLLLNIFVHSISFGQDAKAYRFIIQDETESPVPNATVQVFEGEDLWMAGYTDTLGVFSFEKGKTDQIQVEISYLGYEIWKSPYDLSKESNDIKVQLIPDAKWIDLVTVKADRKIIKQEADRLVLQIDGKNTLGNNAIEILENAPGVLVQENDISYLGKGVKILIDGRPTKLSPTQIGNYLNKKGAYAIKRIALIADPGAAQDASFDGRVINIITQRREGDGYTAGLSTTAIQRSEFLSGTSGVDFHMQHGNLSLFADAGYYNDRRTERSINNRAIDFDSGNTEINESSKVRPEGTGYNYTVGVDYDLHPKSILGFKYVGSQDEANRSLRGLSNIFNNGQLDSLVSIDDETTGDYSSNTFNLNNKTILDSTGAFINLDIDYDIIDNTSASDQIFNTLNTSMEPLHAPDKRFQDIGSRNRLFGVKLDYQKKFTTWKIDAGLKYSQSNIDQTLNQLFDNGTNTLSLLDTLNYREDIYAAYVDIRGKSKFFNYRVSLRSELTDYEGSASSLFASIGDRYLNVFPSVFLAKSLSEKHYVVLAYQKKIRRPRFGQLIPFRRYTSAFFYYVGNPQLQPFFPHSVEARYFYNDKYFISARYEKANNRILGFSQVESNSNVVAGIKQNNGSYEKFVWIAGYNGKIKKWFSLNANFVYSFGSQSLVSEGVEEVFEYDTYNISLNPSFKISKALRANLNLYYSSDVYYDVSQTLNYWNLGFRISQTVLKGAAYISLSGSDLFLKNITRRKADYTNISSYVENNWDSRIFRLSFSYNFGQDDVRKQRKRAKTANNDVRRRVGGN